MASGSPKTPRDLILAVSNLDAAPPFCHLCQIDRDAGLPVKTRIAVRHDQIRLLQFIFNSRFRKQFPAVLPWGTGENLSLTSHISTLPTHLPLQNASSGASVELKPHGKTVRVVRSRRKRRYWEHGCNDGQFSTFSNLLRHQQQESGQGSHAICPNWDAELLRTTALKGLLLYLKCRQIRTESIVVVEAWGQSLPGKVVKKPQWSLNRSSKLEVPLRLLYLPGITWPVSLRSQAVAYLRAPAGKAAASPLLFSQSTQKPRKRRLISSSKAASTQVTSSQLTSTATDSLIVEQNPTWWAAVTPDDTCHLTPDVTPFDKLDMSDLSDGESFETSSGSEGPSPPSSLAESRQNILIDRTISWMITWIDSRLGVLVFQRHGACEEGPQGCSPPQTETGQTTHGPKRKRIKSCHRGGRDQGDEDSDGEERVPPPSQGSDALENEEIVEFACPFLKHNPRKFGQIRSCSASGWKAIFRLKEHLYRCHRLPSFQCIRCRMAFKSSEKLLQHSQADIACSVVRDESGQEGISHEQLMKLKSRKRSREASSEHDRWAHMYKILFPDDYLIPSPYFERGNSGKGQESFLTAFREHVSRELPRLIRPRLEESVDATIREALGPDILEGLVRDIFSQVLSTFPQHKSETPAAMFGKKRKGETSQPTEMFPHLALPGSNSLGLSDVSTFNVEPNASAAWVFSHQAGIEQAESCQEEGQRIDNESFKWQMGYEDPTGVEPGPSNFLSADEHTYLPPAPGDNVVEASSLSDLFNFDDFRDEYAAWLGQADEGSSHADSGYFSSLQSVESMDYMTGKGKGKEVVREPGDHDIT